MSSQQAIKVISPQQAIRILMLSPCYWMLKAPDRKILVEEYCVAYAVACKDFEPTSNNTLRREFDATDRKDS